MFRSLPLVLLLLLVACCPQFALADQLLVPKDFKSVQAAIDAAQPGDTVLVSAGTYAERVRLQPDVTLRSVGDDTAGKNGLLRAEATILDGGGEKGEGAGVVMAEGSRLDGFTIRNVGVYDDVIWQKHHATHGEELGDKEGAAQAEGTVPAVSVRGVNCVVINNIVHHNGDVGIAIVGDKKQRISPLIAGNISYRNMGGGIGVADHAEAIVKENRCFENLRAGIGCRNSSPVVTDNVCYQNVRAGIGCREQARPVIRGNECYENRRAGIGIRMPKTAPVVENNRCYKNQMAGIGCRDGAEPLIRNNQCYENVMAGIGADGARPLIVGNECQKNEMAGIGLSHAAHATISGNRCMENKLVAIGVTGKSTAVVTGNKLSRTGGMPPMIAIKDGSTATISENQIENGGVAAVLVQGSATILENKFQGIGKGQGTAVWVWEGSTANVSRNAFDGYRSAVSATKSTMTVAENTMAHVQNTAIIINASPVPAHVFGNTVIAEAQDLEILKLTGPAGIVGENVVKSEVEDK